MRRYRNRQKGVTIEGVTEQGVTEEYVPASYVEGLNGILYESLPSRPRYLTLSDGQVLDRFNQPEADMVSGNRIQALRASNEAMYNYCPSKGKLPRELRSKMMPVSP